MNSESGFIAIGQEKLHYLKWGSGKRLLLAFHGYADSADMFSLLTRHLEKEYTILSFDIPHHGKSEWSQDALLNRSDLVAVVEGLKTEYKVTKVSLAGYSMGGRFCLSIVEDIPEGIDKVVLIAADGLEVNLYYYIFTRTWLGKKIFRNLLEHPAPYFSVMNLLKKIGLVHPSRHKFVMYFLQSEQSRKFLLNVWSGTSGILPSTAKVKAMIRKYQIPVSIFMGRYDKVMPPSIAEKFRSGLDTVQLITLEKGHRVFDNENAGQIAESLL